VAISGFDAAWPADQEPKSHPIHLGLERKRLAFVVFEKGNDSQKADIQLACSN
jgi:hypothetical protein